MSDGNAMRDRLARALEGIRAEGLYKDERVLLSPQGPGIRVADGREVLNFCANNYLALADHPRVVAAAKAALDDHGFGMASVRFICGTQDLHKRLEDAISAFFGTDDSIVYSSCFDANGGLFETLLGPDDAVISDALNHASIIDGIRLCKARRLRYAHADMDELEARLVEAADAPVRMVATDGVFSMDGDIAPLDRICELAGRHGALVMVDDSHATGFVGPTGRGSAEHHGVMDRVDIFTSTLGKALGGGSGGFTTARGQVVDLLRQRSRPYLFSNALPPPLVAAGIEVFAMLSEAGDLRGRLAASTRRFREGMRAAGFDTRPGEHPIVAVMLYDAALAQRFAAELLGEGIYVIGFSFPVVPRDQARIRVQLSAGHSEADIDRALEAFRTVGRRLGVVS